MSATEEGGASDNDQGLRRAALDTSATILSLQRQVEQQLANTIAVLNATLESTPDGIIAVNLDGRVIASNSKFSAMWGVRPEHLAASEQLIAHIASQIEDESHFLRLTADSRRQPEAECRDTFKTRDGRVVERFVSPQRVDGVCVGVVVNWRDVTAQQIMAAERAASLEGERLARLEAEQANRSKDDFLATLSHELRTPLSTILGWAHILKAQAHDSEKAARAADVIQQNARIQVQLINDLLDMSRIVSGKLRLDVQPVSLPEVIEAALETVRPAADARGVRVHGVIDPITQAVNGDPARLQQVLWNLLSNAIKFTPKGGRVEVTLARVNSQVEIAVTDTGAGISASLLPHVFERFRQGDSSASREHGGLGIGLFVVKTLVELHGGAVRVASEGAGKGATFTVELPLAATDWLNRPLRQHPASPDKGTEVADGPRLDGLRILVVDDQKHTLEAIGQILGAAGAVVLTATSVATALSQLAAVTPDILVSDIGMPHRDGYELIRRVRADGSLIPAAALTAFARSEDRTRALVAGFDAHLTKPVEPGELVATLAALAQRRFRNR